MARPSRATPVQVIQDHARQFLIEMNSKVLAPQLKTLGLIPAVVENDVLQSKSREDANAHLLQHLKENADMKSVMEIFRIASKEPGYGIMNTFADGVLRKLQRESSREKERGEMEVTQSRSEAAVSDRDPLSQPVHCCTGYAVLFRKHVSRQGAGKGKAILEFVGLTTAQIELCYQNNPLNEEEAIQDGLHKWQETQGDLCTWQDLLEAMTFAGIAEQHCSQLVQELHQWMQESSEKERVEQVLGDFRTSFVNMVDANAIVYELKNMGIIDGGDLTTITRTPGAQKKNEYLHECLKNKCDEVALMEVCKVFINVKGNPKMKSLGKKMKSALEVHPMSPWNHQALVSLRADLKLHVLMETGFGNHLEMAAGGFMTPLEAQTVRAQPSNIKQMDKVFDILLGKADKDFTTFLKMLRDSNNVVWAEELEKRAEQFREEVTGREEVEEEKTSREEVNKESLDVLEFQKQYSEVVRNQASVTLKITKCTTIGPPRIGKTCLKNLLIGQEWDVEAGTASTDVMEAPEWVECYSLEDDGAEELWKLVSKEQQKGELIRAINESTTSSTQLTTPDSQHPTKPTDKTTPTDAVATASGTESRIIPASAHPPTSKRGTARKSATVQQALKALAVACSSEALQDFLKDKQGKVLGKRRLIHFIDTGGQSIYHDIHPVLITSPSIYLVVFSLDDFQQKNEQARLSYFRSDLIQRPLRSIYTFGRKNPEEKNLLQLQPEAPKIFIVGTHLDRISLDGQEQFLERIDEMIEEEISSKPYHQFVQYDTEGRSFWAVDNTLAGKEQDEDAKEYISTLRLMVQDRSMEMSVQVPLPWMLLKMVMDGQGVRYCKYSELLEEACSRGYVREGSPDADLDIMLRLFNALGLIYHMVPSECKKEDSLVFIDPDCLYSATSDFLMAAMEEIECNQRGSEEGQIQAAATKDEMADNQGGSEERQIRAVTKDGMAGSQGGSEEGQILAATKDKTADSQGDREKQQIRAATKDQMADIQGGSDEGQIRAATKDEMADIQGGSDEGQIRAVTKDKTADSQGRSDVEKRPYQIYTHLTKPSMDLAGGKQQMESGLAKAQKPRQIPAMRKILGGVESMKVIQRISSSFNAFLSDMRTVLSSLERTVMNVGQDDTNIVLRNLKEIKKGVEEKNSLFDAANTLQSKYRILAQEMVWKLMNSVRKVLQSSTPEDKKPKLYGIMMDFWYQCEMTRRSIDVDDFHHLLLLLTELRIIAGLKQPDCYLIPAALPQLHDQITPVAGDIEPLLFTVTSQDDLLYYLPSGLFCCLISELVTKLGWTVEPLGRTHVAFTHKDLTGVVHVVEHESFIEIKLEPTLQANMDCNSVTEQIDKRINNVYDMIYDPPESRRAVVASLESRRTVVGFKCNCGRGPAHAPHFAAYEEDKFESCVRCLLQGSTDVHMRPLTQQQLVWFPRPAVAGMQ